MSKLEVFVWVDTKQNQAQRIEYSFPAKAMTSNSSQGCTASSSSTYSTNFPAWRAFDLSETSRCWASANPSKGPYLQLTFPVPLYDITVTIVNRGDHNTVINGPIDGDIYGWNTIEGESYAPPPTEGEYKKDDYNIRQGYTGRDGETKQLSTSYFLEDTRRRCCDTIRFQIDNWVGKDTSNNYAAIGEMKIIGYSLPSDGLWVSTNSLT